MKHTLLFIIALFAVSRPAVFAQSGLRQYFDGADTTANQSLIIIRDTAADNTWQIGKPVKTIFNRASTIPNAIITDTSGLYPAGDSSSFSVHFKVSQIAFGTSGLIAIRWQQKLDMEKGKAGGVVEFSKNGGAWQNMFNNSSVYRLYGFAQANKDTLFNGQYAFSGLDTVWRDIWFCMQATSSDSFDVRYTFLSDTGITGREGWIIDNMLVQRTFFHTVGKVESGHAARVYPTSTSGSLIVEAEHRSANHYITSLRITDQSGRIMRQYHDQQSRYILDIGDFPDGRYNVQVRTNLTSEHFSILVHH